MLRTLIYAFLLAFAVPALAAPPADDPQLKTVQNTNGDFDAVARYEEALSYLLGTQGHERSEVKAASIFTELAEDGSVPAQHMLGRLYEQGKGVEKSNKSALEWYSRAADQGFAPSKKKVKQLLRQAPASVAQAEEL